MASTNQATVPIAPAPGYPQQQGYGYNEQPPSYGYPQQGNYGYPQQGSYGYPQPGYQGQASYSHPASSPTSHVEALSHTDEEADKATSFSFNEKSIRLGFIKKVFGILAVQMFITAGIMCAFVFSEDLKNYSMNHQWMYITAMCIYFGALIALICVEPLRRKTPHNLILLFIITLAMSFMLGSIASYFDAKEILMAVGIVFAIVLVCALLGLQQKFDFTYLVGIMIVLTISLLFFGIFAAIFQNNYANIAYACIGAFIFSLWLVIDIQMIIGGKHKYQTNPEEYIFAALNLYLDIVNILMYVLMIIANTKG